MAEGKGIIMKERDSHNWASKKVLVTGAGGFIGSHLCEELISLGANVTAMIRYTGRSDWGNLEFLDPSMKEALRVVAGNVEDSDFVSKVIRESEIVFHLAALIGIPYSYIAPRSYVRTNVEGTLNVLEAARCHEVEKVIQTSTSEVYGTAIYVPIDENHPLQAQSPYSASKIAADKIAESYWRSFGLNVVTIRPFNTYGPRQSARAIIPTIISQALARPEIQLGSLEPVRDLTFVKDMVRAFLKMAEVENLAGFPINIGSGEGVSVGELARKICALMNCKKDIVTSAGRLRPEMSEVYKLICDNDRAHKLLKWQPTYSLEAGLEETICFVSKNLALFKSDRVAI
jgi:NAD dependent epimerase/dehydratase